MSKKKAIESLLRQYDDDGSAENLADRVYEAGRIAGLRKAAKLTDGSAFAVQAHSIGWRKTLEKHANALAKKARAK